MPHDREKMATHGQRRMFTEVSLLSAIVYRQWIAKKCKRRVRERGEFGSGSAASLGLLLAFMRTRSDRLAPEGVPLFSPDGDNY